MTEKLLTREAIDRLDTVRAELTKDTDDEQRADEQYTDGVDRVALQQWLTERLAADAQRRADADDEPKSYADDLVRELEAERLAELRKKRFAEIEEQLSRPIKAGQYESKGKAVYHGLKGKMRDA